MTPLRVALLNVRALRQRWRGLAILVVVGVGLCVAVLGISQRARAASHNGIEEGIANRSIQLERLSDRPETRLLTAHELRKVAEIKDVATVDPVVQASFGYKSTTVSGALLYATTLRRSLPPPVTRSERHPLFPLRPGDVVLPERAGGSSLTSLVGTNITVQVTRSTGIGTGAGVSRRLHVVGVYDPSWQIDGPDAAYVDPGTATAWAALRAGVSVDVFRNTIGYDSATVVARSSQTVAQLLDRLQEDGFAASSLQQQLGSLPGVLDLIRLVGLVLVGALVFVAGFSSYQVTSSLGRQRRREVGVLKAVGHTDARILRMLTYESLILALAAAVIGLGLSIILGTLGNAALRARPDIHGYLRPGMVVASPAVSGITCLAVVLVIVLGSLVAASRAVRMQPSDAIREW